MGIPPPHGIKKAMTLESQKALLIKRFQKFLEGTPKKKFFKFIRIILIGLATSYIFMKKGVRITPEAFRDYVLSLGLAGLIIFTRPYLNNSRAMVA